MTTHDSARHYSAHVELDRRRVTPEQADAMLQHLAPHHGAVGVSPRGWLNAQVTVSAQRVEEATDIAVAVVVRAAQVAGVSAEPIVVEVMTEAEFNIRHGFEQEAADAPAGPALIGAADVAERLGVSTARVGQLASEGKLTATRIGARSRGYDPREVDALRLQRSGRRTGVREPAAP